MNSYLNLPTDDMKITEIIQGHIKKLNKKSSLEDFKTALIEIDNIRESELCEYDDDMICDLYNSLYRKCSSHIDSLKNDTTVLNSGQTVGDLVSFISGLS